MSFLVKDFIVNGRKCELMSGRDKHAIYNLDGEYIGENYSLWDIRYKDNGEWAYGLKWYELTEDEELE